MRRIIYILSVLCFGSCDFFNEESEFYGTSPHVQEYLDGLNLPSYINDTKTYKDALKELDDLGKPGFIKSDFVKCADQDLKPFEERRVLPVFIANTLSSEIQGMSGGDVFEYMSELNDKNDADLHDHFESFSSANEFQISADDIRDRMINHLIWLSSERGSPIGANEVGAAMLYCYQGVKQDVPGAVLALERAVDGGDPMAMMSLSNVLSSGLAGFDDPVRGRALYQRAFEIRVEELRAATDDLFTHQEE